MQSKARMRLPISPS